jgi:hypothetical protein
MFSILLSLFQLVASQAIQPANCITGRIQFNPSRITSSTPVDSSLFDIVIAENPANVELTPQGAVLSLTPNDKRPAFGSKIETSRFLSNGKVSIMLTPSTVSGVVTSMVIVTPTDDQIRIDVAGANQTGAYFSIVSKGSEVNYPFVVEWQTEVINVVVDQVPLYAVGFNKANFPQVPAKIQVSIWDGAVAQSRYAKSFVGGPISWGSNKVSAVVQYIDIQCYDSLNSNVQSMPPSQGSISYPAPTGSIRGDQLPCNSQNCSALIAPFTNSGDNNTVNNNTGTYSPPKTGNTSSAVGNTFTLLGLSLAFSFLMI